MSRDFVLAGVAFAVAAILLLASSAGWLRPVGDRVEAPASTNRWCASCGMVLPGSEYHIHTVNAGPYLDTGGVSLTYGDRGLARDYTANVTVSSDSGESKSWVIR